MREAGGGLHHIDELRDQEHAPETRYDYDQPTEVRDRIEVSEADYRNKLTNLLPVDMVTTMSQKLFHTYLKF